jgi:hypothetical protein
MRKFLTICDKLLCLTVMRLLPQSTKDKVSNRMFQPTLTMRFFERIARKCFNHIFIQLNSEEKKQLTKRIWNGEAGSSWIEQKRKRYESNDMQFFIGQVRQTLDDMVLSFLKDNLQYQHFRYWNWFW